MTADINNFEELKARRFSKFNFREHYLNFTKNIISFCTQEYNKKLRNKMVSIEKEGQQWKYKKYYDLLYL